MCKKIRVQHLHLQKFHWCPWAFKPINTESKSQSQSLHWKSPACIKERLSTSALTCQSPTKRRKRETTETNEDQQWDIHGCMALRWLLHKWIRWTPETLLEHKPSQALDVPVLIMQRYSQGESRTRGVVPEEQPPKAPARVDVDVQSQQQQQGLGSWDWGLEVNVEISK